ncbi:MAG: triose-phosphate isomerase [Pseudomonadota bacterium]|jgi:triosephosphate isomerase (TIM)
MTKPLVIGNWKMNGSRRAIGRLLDDIQTLGGDARVEVVVCPPFVYLAEVARRIAGTGLKLGAQHLSEYPEGAYTGEIGAAMLVDVGCEYVLVGHSERRTLFDASDERVARQFAQALSGGLTPVLCVGEDARQRAAGDTWAVLSRQLATAGLLPGQRWEHRLQEVVIAYEPVWAIGTGVAAGPGDVQAVHHRIREALGERGSQVRILYGGSVSAGNVRQLMAQPDVDGVLVGSASLRATEFATICDAAAVA